MEEILLVDGKPRNPSSTDYLIPTALDVPEIEVAWIEMPEPDAPFGAKGIGEPPVISSTPTSSGSPSDGAGECCPARQLAAPGGPARCPRRDRLHRGRRCARLALTDADKEGRDLVVSWLRDLGLRIDIDGVGNVVGTWPADATEPPVMTGSHIDTVRTGGRYDGNLGVLAGIEALETIITSGLELDRPLAVAFFTNEEGSRFAPDMFGSLVYVGGLPLEVALDTVAVDGAIAADELERIGYVGPMPSPARPPHAFVELHIEQGPVLGAAGDVIGAVTGVQGISWQELTIAGQSNHAGTTPMSLRHDPSFAAASVTTSVRALATELGPPQVATVGRIELHPNLVNVVPARASLTVDLRNTDEATLQLAEARLAAHGDELAAAEGVTIERRTLARFEPVAFDPAMVERVERIATAHGSRVRRLPSGAGHDAQMLARVCPTSMIFTPSVAGISHNPAERTAPEHLEAGANVLLTTLLELAGVRVAAGAPATDGGSAPGAAGGTEEPT